MAAESYGRLSWAKQGKIADLKSDNISSLVDELRLPKTYFEHLEPELVEDLAEIIKARRKRRHKILDGIFFRVLLPLSVLGVGATAYLWGILALFWIVIYFAGALAYITIDDEIG